MHFLNDIRQAGGSPERRALVLRRGMGAGLPCLDACNGDEQHAGPLSLHALYRFCMMEPAVDRRGRTDDDDDGGTGKGSVEVEPEFAELLSDVRRHTGGALEISSGDDMVWYHAVRAEPENFSLTRSY